MFHSLIKKCKKCDEEKPVDDFYMNARMADGRNSKCKKCEAIIYKEWCSKNRELRLKINKEWRSRNIETVRKKEYQKFLRTRESRKEKRNAFNKSEKGKDYYLIKNYGISLVHFKEIKDNQENKCAICYRSELETKRKMLFVDHCHHSGKVRSLLCNDCNAGIGMFEDCPDRLMSAIYYLILHKKESHLIRGSL